jgi:hypothetical protein
MNVPTQAELDAEHRPGFNCDPKTRVNVTLTLGEIFAVQYGMYLVGFGLNNPVIGKTYESEIRKLMKQLDRGQFKDESDKQLAEHIIKGFAFVCAHENYVESLCEKTRQAIPDNIPTT